MKSYCAICGTETNQVDSIMPQHIICLSCGYCTECYEKVLAEEELES